MREILYSLIIVLYLGGCGLDETSERQVTQDDIIHDFAIERLQDDIYYFPSKNTDDNTTHYQPLRRFDIIFTGHDIDDASGAANTSTLARAIPGKYTHLFSYIGKDSEGFAYAVEMNTDENQSHTVGLDGLKVGGQLYVYCIGSDFGLKACPKEEYHYGLETYDYMWAKSVKSELKEQLRSHEEQLMATIKDDLQRAYPFRLPFELGLEVFITKTIKIADDSDQQGADCTSYFTSLFEEVAGVCLEDIRLDASSLESYYLYDPLGQDAIIPEKYNIFTQEGDLPFAELLSDLGYSRQDNQPRQTSCQDAQIVMGIPTPDRLFASPSLIDIESISEIIQ